MKSFIAALFTVMILAISASALAMPRTHERSHSNGPHSVHVYLTQFDIEYFDVMLLS
ncbi:MULTISPECIES: hypothetical protein [unclassified Pseudomonas]|uniref:hypothetical protein n=1 Tax=unclassified Pseudomonas TaxID=196821 RepID=UPI002AC8D49C|nr:MULTISPECIES: hypothetical protein [unclassified Pseudomonas]MEB0041364.1 hypothetical protein [Pseudomonas sp. MH10]MEB0076232.1 hypothetical protein [Pseudomonas sp. MH10out]MEB0090727.1 hypothetical protein [Pseudomonas sp. CCI4.2]MEB0100595.1 hypothetical protein [Pseudomonas sp. CCI3.2]MEB0121347.1 hypothetical protein [Pseudomonas sp. CCI1.2]